jgi:hypothetical protein
MQGEESSNPVSAHEVADAAGWGQASKGGMASVAIVVVEPELEGFGSSQGVFAGLSIGPAV